MWMCVCLYVYICTVCLPHTHRSWKKALNPLELASVTDNCDPPKPRPSVRTARLLNCGAIVSVPSITSVYKFKSSKVWGLLGKKTAGKVQVSTYMPERGCSCPHSSL